MRTRFGMTRQEFRDFFYQLSEEQKRQLEQLVAEMKAGRRSERKSGK